MATSSCQPAQRVTLSLERLANLIDRQVEFFKALAKYDFVLYGGEAGGGKSYALRWWLVLYLVWCFKVLGLRNVRVGLFCEDYPNLVDRQICKIAVEFPKWLGTLTSTKPPDFKLRDEFGGGVLALRNLDKLEKYKSAEFAAIAVDELTLHKLTVFNWLRFRLRWPGIERPKFLAATNPGGPGHSWVKAYWHDKEFPAELKPVANQFHLVRCKSSDNAHVSDNYHERNLTLPPDMARMVARGDWNVFTGQFFPQFEQKRHVIPAAEAFRRIKPWWTKFLSGDWGFEHPSCYHWHAKDEHNRIITYRELWDRRVGEAEWGKRLTNASIDRDGQPERLGSFPFSWDAGRQSPRSPNAKHPKSIVQLVSDALGPNMPQPFPADSSPGSRMSGYRLMSQLLDADMWLISDACPRLIECLPTLIRDESAPEQVLKVDYAEGDTIGDDPADSARMGLQHEFGTAVVPVNVVADRRVAAYAAERGKEVEDLEPTSNHMLHLQARIAEERSRRRNRRAGGRGHGRVWRPRS